MDKTYKSELRRLFLINNLPEPLTRASSHLQIFDNYIENTRLRLRSMRAPETKQWTWILQQRFPVGEDLSRWKISEIYLDENEHRVFEQFEGREIKKNERVESNEVRKNRYFLDYENRQIEIDAFLGDLWGLNLAKICFETENEMEFFDVPPFAVREVTNNSFFTGENLIGKKFSDVQKEFEKMISAHQIIAETPDQ
jgi:hypothetical protein